MNNSIASPLDAASSMRQLKILVLLLLFSNVVLGVFGYWFLRELDRKYSSLIGDTVPTLKDLQRLTVATSEGMHGTNPAFVNGPEEHRLTMVQRGRDALQRDRDMRHRVLNARW